MTTPTTTIDKNFSYFYNAFLSYSKESEYEAKRLYKILRLNGLRVWFDLYEINKTSKFYKDEISIALKYTPVFICLINEYYVNSINCYNEIVYAFKSNKIIIALRMERCHLIKYNYIGFILSLSNKCNLYEDNEEFFKNVRGTAYDQLLSIIRTLFKSKVGFIYFYIYLKQYSIKIRINFYRESD